MTEPAELQPAKKDQPGRIFPSILLGLFAVLGSSCERQPQSPTTQQKFPPPAMTWRNNPLLKQRFLKDYPDDLQILVHDGGPRLIKAVPELVWARVTGELDANTFVATVLNQPTQLTKVRERDSITFMVKETWKHPVQVHEDYLKERNSWVINPCDKCGFDELFDPPASLISVIFPNLPKDAQLDSFTSFCPLCGGIQVIQSKDADRR